MRVVLIACAMIAVLVALRGPARLTLDFADANDPSPRKMELAAEAAGIVAAVAIRWTDCRAALRIR